MTLSNDGRSTVSTSYGIGAVVKLSDSIYSKVLIIHRTLDGMQFPAFLLIR